MKLLTVEQDSQIFEVEETDYNKATRANSNYNIHPEEILAEHFSLLFYKIINDPNIIVDYADPINELLDVLKNRRNFENYY